LSNLLLILQFKKFIKFDIFSIKPVCQRTYFPPSGGSGLKV